MGILLAPYVEENPASFRVFPAHKPAVEGEFAFRMGRSLPARAEPYTTEDIVGGVEAVAGAIEIVGTRFSGGLTGKGRLLTTADGGVNIALVTGRWTPFERQDLRAHAVTMVINGMKSGSGTGSRALGDPLIVLLWLVNDLSKRQLSLQAREIVSTGTC
ncbi:MAG: hypothetical protein AB7O71_22675, partial [Hyphomicrobiaceae bacterium]